MRIFKLHIRAGFRQHEFRSYLYFSLQQDKIVEITITYLIYILLSVNPYMNF